MTDQLNSLYKVMIMYIVWRAGFALTNLQIANVFLDLGYTNYFNVQYALGDLVSSKLVRKDEHSDYSSYLLTEDGLESIKVLKNSLATSIQTDIDNHLRENHLQMLEEAAVKSDFYRTTDGDYAVRCRVIDRACPLIELTITVPNKTQAKTVSKNWKKTSQQIYAYVMHALSGADTDNQDETDCRNDN